MQKFYKHFVFVEYIKKSNALELEWEPLAKLNLFVFLPIFTIIQLFYIFFGTVTFWTVMVPLGIVYMYNSSKLKKLRGKYFYHFEFLDEELMFLFDRLGTFLKMNSNLIGALKLSNEKTKFEYLKLKLDEFIEVTELDHQNEEAYIELSSIFDNPTSKRLIFSFQSAVLNTNRDSDKIINEMLAVISQVKVAKLAEDANWQQEKITRTLNLAIYGLIIYSFAFVFILIMNIWTTAMGGF